MDGIAQLALTLAVGTVASFAVFKLSVLLYERVKSPLLNPLLVTVAFIIAALVALRWHTRCTGSARRSRSTSFPSSRAAL